MKIVSGGQTGADRAALDVALELNNPCGGWCPEGREAEDGVIDAKYPLEELPGGGYRERTRQNVLDSDGTAILAFGPPTGGTLATLKDSQKNHKPNLVIDLDEITTEKAAQLLTAFVAENQIGILNIAGPRASTDTRIYAAVAEILRRFLLPDTGKTG